MNTSESRLSCRGHVRPPADLVGAARAGLTPENFQSLMARTSGKPTAHDVVSAVDAQRVAQVL